MTLTEKIAQHAFNNVQDSAEDEYQEQTLYKSFAVGYYTLPATLYAVGAVLAWSLPSRISSLSFLVIVPLLVSEGFSKAWLKDKAPRAKAARGTGYYLSFCIPLALWLGGLCFRLTQDGEAIMGAGIIVGAIVGGVAAGVLTPRILNKQRAQDKERLEAALED